MQRVYDGLANAQPQTGALRKAVFFVKAFEDMFLGVFRDTAFHVSSTKMVVYPSRFDDIAEGDAARYVNFLALFIRLFTTCFKRTESVMTNLSSPSGISRRSSTSRGILRRWDSWTSCMINARLNAPNLKSIVPDSMRERSRISLSTPAAMYS